MYFQPVERQKLALRSEEWLRCFDVQRDAFRDDTRGRQVLDFLGRNRGQWAVEAWAAGYRPDAEPLVLAQELH